VGWKLQKTTITIMKVTNKMKLCRLIYYSLSALRVLGDVFAHHQKYLTVFTASASSSNASMTPAGSNIAEYYQMLMGKNIARNM
jgi:hypothetical protein